MLQTHELILEPGLIVEQEFFDYALMQQSAKNWLYLSKYRFGTGPFYGCHDGVQLNNLQFGHADRHEGMMIEGFSPKNCLTIAILQKSTGCVCVNRLKMKPGDVIVIDDSKPYDFVSSHHTRLAIVSISKSLVATEIPWMLCAADKKFKDKDNILSDTIESEWRCAAEGADLSGNTDAIKAMEQMIINAVKNAFVKQTGVGCHLTAGEETAFEVKAFLLNSLEENMTIQSIVEQFGVTDKTLESSFKSLFGIRPKHFIDLLKLNRAHEDLLSADVQTINVSDIAIKWSFSNFGRFAHSYKELFGVLPSETIRKIVI